MIEAHDENVHSRNRPTHSRSVVSLQQDHSASPSGSGASTPRKLNSYLQYIDSDALLRIKETRFENAYMKNFAHRFLAMDRLMAIVKLPLHAIALYKIPHWNTAIWLHTVIHLPFYITVILASRTERYLKHRRRILYYFKIVRPVLFHLFLLHAEAHVLNSSSDSSFVQGNASIALRSATTVLSLLGYRQAFADSVHTAGVIMLCASVLSFHRCKQECTLSAAHSEYYVHMFRAASIKLAHYIPIPSIDALTNQEPVLLPPVPSCFILLSLTQLTVGILVPLAVAYAEELDHRSNWLALRDKSTPLIPEFSRTLFHHVVFALLLSGLLAVMVLNVAGIVAQFLYA